jgi:chromosome segregation ATPase
MTRHDTDEDKRQVTAEGTWREGSASWWEAVAIKRAGAIKDLEKQLASSKAENGRLARGLQSQQTSHERFRQLEQQLAAANTDRKFLEKELHNAEEQLVVRHPQYDAVSRQLKAATEKLAKALALNDSWCAKCPYIIDSADCARNDCHEHEMRKLLRGDA